MVTAIREGYSYKELFPLVYHTLGRDISVLVKGKPGCGKSTMAEELADKFREDLRKKTGNKDLKFPLIILRLASMDPSEICGIQVPNRETKTIEHYMPDWVPLHEPAFIFLDEINAAVTNLHQSVAFQIVLDHRVGPFRFAPGTKVMAAGNMAEDSAIVKELASPLNNRFAHFALRPDVDAWLEWASKQPGIEEDMIGYVALHREKALYDNDGGHDAFPTPRSMAMAGKINGVASMEMKRDLVASCIGEAHAAQYMAFVKIYKNIKLEDIFEKGIIPDLESQERSFLYALMCACASYLNKLSAAKLKGDRVKNTVKLLAQMKDKVEYLVVMFGLIKNQSGLLAALQTCPDFKDIALTINRIMTTAMRKEATTEAA